MIGVAKSKGSLTAKLTGINDALPTAFNCFDLANSKKRYGTTSVAPELIAITGLASGEYEIVSALLDNAEVGERSATVTIRLTTVLVL